MKKMNEAVDTVRREEVRRVILTASGGPFRTWTIDAIRKVTVEQALKHPTWSMGPKVTIDSATLMNKGLELIEARHLFALKPEELDVVVHPQSIIHGLVEYRDGSVIACISVSGPAGRLSRAIVDQVGTACREAADAIN